MMNTVQEAIEELKKGNMLIVVDSPDRENQGDIIFPAESATTEQVNFLLEECRGMVCVAINKDIATRLELPLMVPPIDTTEKTRVQFTVTVDAKDVTSFGISSSDRAKTIQTLANVDSTPKDLVRPGHIFPLLSRDGGVLEREGHTEATVDLMRLSGHTPAGILCEILREDGEPARLPELEAFSKKHGIKMISVEALKEYIKEHPQKKCTASCVAKTAEATLPTEYGTFRIHVYKCVIDSREHVALVMGEPHAGMLTRVHSECLTGDTFGSRTCDCGPQLRRSMELIQEAGSGIILYLNQEGRGIGLTNKIKAYALQQEQGLDTFEANVALGFNPDERNFEVASEMLEDLGVKSIKLLTNNPDKKDSLEKFGISVIERVPLEISPTDTTKRYLATKKEKFGHDLKEV